MANKGKQIFAIIDGAAFGADMQNVVHALRMSKGSHVWAPESFEYLILQSGIIQAAGLGKIIENPGAFIESGEYSSWERFFTQLLEELTKHTIYTYREGKLNSNYLTKKILKK